MLPVNDLDVLPYASGWSVYEAAPEPKSFFALRGPHGEMVELEPELYTRTVIAWLGQTPQHDQRPSNPRPSANRDVRPASLAAWDIPRWGADFVSPWRKNARRR